MIGYSNRVSVSGKRNVAIPLVANAISTLSVDTGSPVEGTEELFDIILNILKDNITYLDIAYQGDAGWTSCISSPVGLSKRASIINSNSEHSITFETKLSSATAGENISSGSGKHIYLLLRGRGLSGGSGTVYFFVDTGAATYKIEAGESQKIIWTVSFKSGVIEEIR